MNQTEPTPPVAKFRVELNWKLVVAALLLLPLLISLGVWQLQRAEEKRTIQESWQRQQALPPVALSQLDDLPDGASRRVYMEGEFDTEHYWLLENQMVGGRLGYNVVMPFHIPGTMGRDDRLVIVDRGWVPADAYRSELPQVETPAGVQHISGRLVEPSSNRLIEETGEPPASWPVRLLELDVDAMARQLRAAGYTGAPHERVLRIDEDSPAALAVNWQPVNMQPATHRGYAVQWFALALALVILSVFANTNLSEILLRKRRR